MVSTPQFLTFYTREDGQSEFTAQSEQSGLRAKQIFLP
jgi:hypothetical protein